MPEALFVLFHLASKGANVCKRFFMVFLLGSKGAKVYKSCRSRQELSNEYLLPKFGVDTAESGLPASQPAENEPLKVCQKVARS